jgi:hypothetical protein
LAYPFTRFPTLKEFVDRVTRDYDCVERTASAPVKGAKGLHPIRYLDRNLPNGHKKAVLPDVPDNKRLNRQVLESLCKRLDLPLDHFGLPLD